MCHDAAYDSCGPFAYATQADQHMPVKRVVGYPVGSVTKKVVLLPAELTIQGGCFLLFKLALCYCPHSYSK
jgi:hypothetical protein